MLINFLIFNFQFFGEKIIFAKKFDHNSNDDDKNTPKDLYLLVNEDKIGENIKYIQVEFLIDIMVIDLMMINSCEFTLPIIIQT